MRKRCQTSLDLTDAGTSGVHVNERLRGGTRDGPRQATGVGTSRSSRGLHSSRGGISTEDSVSDGRILTGLISVRVGKCHGGSAGRSVSLGGCDGNCQGSRFERHVYIKVSTVRSFGLPLDVDIGCTADNGVGLSQGERRSFAVGVDAERLKGIGVGSNGICVRVAVGPCRAELVVIKAERLPSGALEETG